MLASLAGVAEWYTRTTQNRLSKGMRVRVPPPAQLQKKRAHTSSIFVCAGEKGR